MLKELHLIAHNIRSCENVGALFRLADSLGIARLWLSGYTPAPPDPRIHKTALGAEAWVPFSQVTDIQGVFEVLSQEKIPVYALELAPDAVDIRHAHLSDRAALLLGTETTGIPPSLIERCAGTVFIPQRGKKESLNVATAAAIASWELLR